MSKAESELVIQNVGAIKDISLSPEPGTITVFRGYNGEGKSTILGVASNLARGKPPLTNRDGTTSGMARGWGVTVTIGRTGKNRRVGDLCLGTIEDKLSIADFVDPKIKDLNAADQHRLKALINLVGVVPDPTIYHEIAGGKQEFEEIVKPETLESTDSITLAERIKRNMEEASRLQETKATRLFGEIKAKRAANDGLDLKAEHDESKLQAALESALNARSTIVGQKTAAEGTAQARESAKTSLEAAKANYSGPSLDAASEQVEAAKVAKGAADRRLGETNKIVELIKKQLAEAEAIKVKDEAAVQAAATAVTTAETVQQAAETHWNAVSEWEKTLAAPFTAADFAPQLSHADGVLKVARIAHETGALIRAALKREEEAEQLEQDRLKAINRMNSLKNAALSVLDVLSKQIDGLIPGLKLDGELRIIVPHKTRKECYFAELSHGEKWKMAIDIAVETFKRKGMDGLLGIPQEAWEGLDGRNREELAEHIGQTDLIVLTAEAERSTDAKEAIIIDVIDRRPGSTQVPTTKAV